MIIDVSDNMQSQLEKLCFLEAEVNLSESLRGSTGIKGRALAGSEWVPFRIRSPKSLFFANIQFRFPSVTSSLTK